MDPSILATLIASFLGALASVLATSVSALTIKRERHRKLAETDRVSIENVLESNDIRKLGNFLDETVGQFDVSEYVDSQDVAKTIDRYFEGVIEFLGTSENIREEEAVPPPTFRSQVPHDQDKLPEPLQAIMIDLEQGEVWNGLAKLRMLVEVQLRERAVRLGYRERHLRSAGQILHVLAEREEVSPEIVVPLRYAVAICNKAIHGQDVSMDEAEEAVLIARQALHELNSAYPP